MTLNLNVGDHYRPGGTNRDLEIVQVTPSAHLGADPTYDAVDEHGDAWVVVDGHAVLTVVAPSPALPLGVFDPMGGAA